MIWGFMECLTRGRTEDNSTKRHVFVPREGFTQVVASDLRACPRQDSAATWPRADSAVCGRFHGFPGPPLRKGELGSISEQKQKSWTVAFRSTAIDASCPRQTAACDPGAVAISCRRHPGWETDVLRNGSGWLSRSHTSIHEALSCPERAGGYFPQRFKPEGGLQRGFLACLRKSGAGGRRAGPPHSFPAGA